MVSGERRVIPARYQTIATTMKITKASKIASGPLKYAATITPGTASRPSKVAGRYPARRNEL